MVRQSGSLPDMYSTYFYSLLFWMVVCQAVFVGLLIMPLPSNRIRGIIISFIDKIWNASPQLQHLCVAVTGILALVFVSSVHALLMLNDIDVHGISETLFAAEERTMARYSVVEAQVRVLVSWPYAVVNLMFYSEIYL